MSQTNQNSEQTSHQKFTSFLIRKPRFFRRQRIILRRRINRDIRMALADLEGVFRWPLLDHARIAVQQDLNPCRYDPAWRHNPRLRSVVVGGHDRVVGQPRDDPDEAVYDDVRKDTNYYAICDAMPCQRPSVKSRWGMDLLV